MKRLNFGCGRIVKSGFVNVDGQKGDGIDKSFDFLEYPYPFDDNEFDYVLIDNVLEHLQNPDKVLKEIWRICKPGAFIEIIVPYYNSYYAYADTTHVNYFSEISMGQVLGGFEYDTSRGSRLFDFKMKSVPQRFLRFVPMVVLNVLKRFLGNVVVELRVRARVLK